MGTKPTSSTLSCTVFVRSVILRIWQTIIVMIVATLLLAACSVKSLSNQDIDKQNSDTKLRSELKAAEKNYGLNSKEVVVILKKLGTHYKLNHHSKKEGAIYDRLARIRWAPKEKALRQAIKDAQDNYGRNSSQSITAHIKLAKFFSRQSTRKERFALLEQSLKLARERYVEDQAELAKILYQIGNLFSRSALLINDSNEISELKLQLKRAETLLIESLERYDNNRDPDPRYRKKVVKRLYSLYRVSKQHNKAVEIIERGLRIDVKYQAGKQQDIAKGLYELGKKQNRLKKYTAALYALKRSLELDKAQYGKQHRYISVTQHELGKVYANKMQYTNALLAYKASLAIATKLYPNGSTDVALDLRDLASVYTKLGLYDRALPLLKNSLAMYKKLLKYDHRSVLKGYHHLSLLLVDMGNYSEALTYSLQALEIIKGRDKPSNRDIAYVMNSLAIIYQEQGNYSKASEQYTKALAILKKIKNSAYPTILGNYAVLLAKLGQNDKALSLHKQSIAIFKKKRPINYLSLAKELSNLGGLYIEMGKPKKAVPVLEQSLAIRENIFPQNHPLIAMSLNNLAVAYVQLEKIDKAVALHQRVSNIYKALYSADHPVMAKHYNNLAHMYLNLGKLKKSEQMMFKALTLAQSGQGNSEILWRVQSGLGVLYTQLQRHELAIFWGKLAVNTIQGLRVNLANLDKQTNTGFLSNKRYVYQNLADLLITQGRIKEAQSVLQMLKEQELYNSLQRAAKIDPRQTRIKLTGLEQKRFAKYYKLQDEQISLGKERATLLRKLKLGAISDVEKKRVIEINEQLLPLLREAMLVFLQELQKLSDQFAKDKAYRQTEPRLDVAETNLQKAMIQTLHTNPDTKIAALQYVVTDKRLSILLSTANNPPVAKQIKFDGKTLASDILTVRELLIASNSSQGDSTLLNNKLKSLYNLLIEPIAKELITLDAKTLILVPNDVLRYIPFAALYDGKRYLIQDYSLTLFNEAVKKDFTSNSSQNTKLAAMGLSQAVDKFPALSMVPDELTAVAVTSGIKGKTYLDEAFTRVVLKNALKQDFTILHLASHFEFVSGRADASRFFLGDKSSLYLGDIVRENLRFDNFSLVTFSACETGLGGGLDADGSEMESLGALVQNQGARAVMATLWKVADKSTSEFMSLFYRYYHELKISKAEALRKTQLKFIKAKSSGRRAWSRPYFWAPFVLMGDWR